METMRRALILVAVFGLLGLATGCHHVAGACDCDAPDCPGSCVHGPAHLDVGPTAIPPVVKPEQIKDMPKGTVPEKIGEPKKEE
jgi:hypothetical protein